MNKKYKVWVETENIGDKKLVYLFVSHKDSSSTGIRIEDPVFEIPLIVDALQRHLTSAIHSDGEGLCEHEWGTDGMHSNEFCKKCFIDRPPVIAGAL